MTPELARVIMLLNMTGQSHLGAEITLLDLKATRYDAMRACFTWDEGDPPGEFDASADECVRRCVGVLN